MNNNTITFEVRLEGNRHDEDNSTTLHIIRTSEFSAHLIIQDIVKLLTDINLKATNHELRNVLLPERQLRLRNLFLATLALFIPPHAYDDYITGGSFIYTGEYS